MRRLALMTLCFCLFSSQWAWAEWRDPTRPPGFQGVSVSVKSSLQAGALGQGVPSDMVSTIPDLELTAILVSPFRRIAHVNGQLVREGSIIDGVKVVEIKPDEVRFKGEVGEFTIHLLPSVRQKAGEER